jgi:PAS domain S-box-containing protein
MNADKALRADKAEAKNGSLQASELNCRRLFEAARDGILILDANTGRITDVNPFLAELLGFSHDEMVGKTVGELSPFKNIMANQDILEQLQKDGYVRYEDLPLETKDGRRIAVEFAGNIYQAGDKKEIQCNIRDITKRKTAETAMSRLAAIVESSDDAIIGEDLNGIITSWNKGAEKISGYTASEMVGTSIMRLIPADRQNEANQILNVIKRGQSMEHFEMLMQTKNGRLIDVSVTASPIKDATGKAIGTSKVARDITQRKQAEQTVRRERDFSEAVLNSLPGVFYLFNQNGKYLRWNKNFEQVTGYTAAEIATMHPLDFFAGAEKDPVAARINEVFQKGESNVEAGYLFKNGRVTPYYFTGTLVQIDGQPCLLGVGIDATERKRAEEALKNSHAQLRALSARLQSVREEEAIRIAREIHDDLGQKLSGYGMGDPIPSDYRTHPVALLRFLPK